MEQGDSETPSRKISMVEQDFARCTWCGIPASEKWLTFIPGERFCSQKCASTKLTGADVIGCFLCFCMILTGTIMFLDLFLGILAGIPLIIPTLVYYRSIRREARRLREERPRDSRRYKVIRITQSTSVRSCYSCGE